jgi:hypothetical protein
MTTRNRRAAAQAEEIRNKIRRLLQGYPPFARVTAEQIRRDLGMPLALRTIRRHLAEIREAAADSWPARQPFP